MPRVPIAVASPIEPRLPSQDKDCRLINCYAEQQAEGTQIVKRPGLTQFGTVTAGCAQHIGEGADGTLITIVGGVATGASPAASGANWYRDTITAGFAPRNSHFTASLSGVLYMGLGIDPSPTNLSDFWKSTDNGVTWTQTAASTGMGPRTSPKALVFNGVIYLIAARFNNGTLSNDVWTTTDGVTLTEILAYNISPPATQFVARLTPAVCVHAGKMWVLGGEAATFTSEVWHSTNGITWTQVSAAAPWPGRRGHAAVSFGGYIYIFGGHTTGPVYFNDVWRSADGITWTQILTDTATPPATQFSRRSNLSGCVYGGFMWAVCGAEVTGFNEVWKSSSGSSWTKIAPQNTGLSVTTLNRVGQTVTATTVSPHGFVATNYVTILAGIYSGTWIIATVPTTTTFTFTVTGSPANDGAQTVVRQMSGRALFDAVPHNNSIYIVAGDRSSGATDAWHAVVDAVGSTTTLTTALVCPPFDSADSPATATGNGFTMFKTTMEAWYYQDGIWTEITDLDYPAVTVRGVANMNGYFFVMTPWGGIQNSDVRDPANWRATNVIQADSFPDAAVAIARQLQYIVAFKETSIQFFYINSAATLTESALLPYLNSTLRIGCAAGGSVVGSDNTLFFVSQSQQRGRSVMRLDGTTPAPIGNEWVNRILNADDLVDLTSYCVKSAGHWWYIINLPTSDITLTFDAITGEWHRWSSLYADTAKSVSSLTYDTTTALVTVTFGTAQVIADGDVVVIAGATPSAYNGTVIFWGSAGTTYTYTPLSVPASTPATGTITATPYLETNFRGAFYANNGTFDLVLGVSDGIIYKIDPAAGDDAGIPINMDARLPEYDGGSYREKFMGQLDVVADKPNGTLYVRHSDDDYATYSAYRAVSLSARRSKMVARPARFVRRAFQLRYTGNTMLRINRIDADVEPGVF